MFFWFNDDHNCHPSMWMWRGLGTAWFCFWKCFLCCSLLVLHCSDTTHTTGHQKWFSEVQSCHLARKRRVASRRRQGAQNGLALGHCHLSICGPQPEWWSIMQRECCRDKVINQSQWRHSHLFSQSIVMLMQAQSRRGEEGMLQGQSHQSKSMDTLSFVFTVNCHVDASTVPEG